MNRHYSKFWDPKENTKEVEENNVNYVLAQNSHASEDSKARIIERKEVKIVARV